jgi:ribonuclease-3
VKGETLAKVAVEFDLGSHLHLGSGELNSGGHQRSSILADALEAIIAAIYLDSDFDTCRQRIVAWFAPRLDDLHLAPTLKDPKTQLQEHLQARKMGLPVYSVSSLTGKAHDQDFVMKCEVQGLGLSEEGHGKSRRRAEQAAAKAMLEYLLKNKSK